MPKDYSQDTTINTKLLTAYRLPSARNKLVIYNRRIQNQESSSSEEMVMVAKLIAEHKDKLAPELQQTANKFLAKKKAIDTAISENNLSHCVIQIEQVRMDKPATLFGQSAKSLSCNRINVYTGKYSKERHEFMPDKHVLSALLSERSLSNMLLNTARSAPEPITFTKALGSDIQPIQSQRTNTIDQVKRELKDLMDSRLGKINNAIEAVSESIQARNAMEKRKKEYIYGAINSATNVQEDTLFYLKRLREGLSSDVSDIRTEVTNVMQIQNSNHVTKLELPSPTQAEDQHENAVKSSILGYYTEEEERMIKAVCDMELSKIAKDNGFEYTEDLYDAPAKNFVMKLPFNAREEKKHVAKVCFMRNDVTNVSILESRRNLTLQNGCINISRINGRCDEVFSEYETDVDAYFEIYISSAISESFYGNHSIREAEPLITIRITQDDLLNAIRGNFNNGNTPCTIARFCKENVPFKKDYKDSASKIIEESGIDVADEALINLAKEVINEVEALKGSQKKKESLIASLEKLKMSIIADNEKIQDKFASVSKEFTEQVFSNLQKSLKNANPELNNTVLMKLMNNGS